MTDCLTAIHYLFKQAMNVQIPLTYIGDMPRALISRTEWRPLSLRREEAQCGDLFFVKNKEKPKLLSHIALFIDAHLVFHCNPEDKTAVIEEYELFSKRYVQHLNFRTAVRYIDPRNQQKRAEEEGLFVN